MSSKKWLFQPLDKLVRTQAFGENKACIPIRGGATITCDGHNPPIGYKSVYSRMKGHNGTDYKTYSGQPIYAAQDGIVTELVHEDERGLGLGIQTLRKHWCEETQTEEFFKIRYWHNQMNCVKKGDTVKLGQRIARSDNTGYSSGDHLHFEIKPVSSKGRKLVYKNGYFGAVDPEQYLLPVKASIFKKTKTLGDRITVALKLWLRMPL